MRTDSSIPEFLIAAIDHGNQLIAAQEQHDRAVAAQRRDDELAELAEAWLPVLATIHQATPEWVHEYIVAPMDSSTTLFDGYYSFNRAVTISLSSLLADVPTIRVWANPHNQNPSILFEAGRYSLVHDDEIGQWFVMTRFDNYKVTDHDLHYFQPDGPGATDNFHVALAQAVADRTDLAALQAEADRMNALPAAEPVEASVPPAPIDPIERIANYLERVAALYEQHHKF
ncbi:MAG: hypothetical protein KAX65_12850 [Caldilineaceae bacterium]|nr:hypothetical protein [Caldilineaceae bacterium]